MSFFSVFAGMSPVTSTSKLPAEHRAVSPASFWFFFPTGGIDPQRRAAERQALHILDKDRLDSLLRGDGADFVLHAVLVLERRQVQPLHLHALEQQLEPLVWSAW